VFTLFVYIIKRLYRSRLVCEASRPTDLMFVYDAASLGSRRSTMITELTRQIVYDLDLSNGFLRVGRMTDNCPSSTDVIMSASNNVFQLSRIEFPGYHTLVQRLNMNAFSSSFGARENAKRMAVFFVDENTQNLKAAVAEVRRLHKVETFVVAIGNRRSRYLAQFASLPLDQHMIKVSAYSDLAAIRPMILEQLCYRLGL
jgi:hypothetical protein